MRFYFYTLDGQPLEKVFENLRPSSCGSAIAIKENERWIKKKFETKKGNLIGRTSIGVFINERHDTKKITIEDFNGNEVLVKHWSPDESEWFLLTNLQSEEQLACDVPMFK
jgi:hypothetical protein